MGVHKRAHHIVLRWQYNNNKTNKPQLVSLLSPWGEPESGFPRCLTQAAETPTELPGCVPSQPSSWGRNAMSMNSWMNGHLSCLDDYALIIVAPYFSVSCLSAPAHCVLSHRWVIKKRMGAILFGAHSFPTMIVGSVTGLSFDLVVHSHPAESRRGLLLRQSLVEGCLE